MSSKVMVKLSPAFCFMLAMMLLILPLKWLLAAVIAAIYHELCHMAAIRLYRGNIHKLALGAGGACLDISTLSPIQELICSLAGPIGGLALLLLSKWIPRIAVCAAFQSLYNLLPIYPLDGGRALRCGVIMVMAEDSAEKFCKFAESVCLTGILLTALYGAIFLRLGIISFFPAVLIFIRTKYRKTPCKQESQRLQ